MQYGIKYTISFPRLDKRIFLLFLCSVSMNRLFSKIVCLSRIYDCLQASDIFVFSLFGYLCPDITHCNIPPRCFICTNYGKISKIWTALFKTDRYIHFFSNQLYYTVARNEECQINVSLPLKKRVFGLWIIIFKSYITKN